MLDTPSADLVILVLPCYIANPNCVYDADVMKRLDFITVLPQRTFDPDNIHDPVDTISSIEEILTIDYRTKINVKF